MVLSEQRAPWGVIGGVERMRKGNHKGREAGKKGQSLWGSEGGALPLECDRMERNGGLYLRCGSVMRHLAGHREELRLGHVQGHWNF